MEIELEKIETSQVTKEVIHRFIRRFFSVHVGGSWVKSTREAKGEESKDF